MSADTYRHHVGAPNAAEQEQLSRLKVAIAPAAARRTTADKMRAAEAKQAMSGVPTPLRAKSPGKTAPNLGRKCGPDAEGTAGSQSGRCYTWHFASQLALLTSTRIKPHQRPKIESDTFMMDGLECQLVLWPFGRPKVSSKGQAALYLSADEDCVIEFSLKAGEEDGSDFVKEFGETEAGASDFAACDSLKGLESVTVSLLQ